ncbi:MAG: ATP-binding protein [Burkholderiaceae bacterium]
MNPAAGQRSLRRAIDDECLRLSFEHLLYITWATTLMVLALAAIMTRHLPVESLLGWVAIYVVLSLVRLGVALWYRARERSGDDLRRMLPWLTAGLILAPLSWSILPFLTPRDDTAAYLIQLMFAGGLVAGGAQTLIGTPRILLVNTLLTMAPFVVRLLGSGITEQVYMGLLAIFYYLSTLHFGRRNLKVIRESIALRFSNLQLVADLTQAKEQAEQARDTAERAIEAKNRFLAAASHDIRQPMHAALLFIGALDHTARAGNRPVIDRLQAALTAAREMLDTLLDVSQLDAGVVRRNDVTFRAEAAGQRIVEMFDPVATHKGLAIGLRCPPDLWLHADPALVQRVLVNLVSNAVKYTERGAVLIAMRRRGDACLVQIWDTGIGIAEAQQASIFDEFMQLDNPERDRSRGTGLGLTTVRRLCRLLGTQITVRSRPGHGSVFAFRLPLGQAMVGQPPGAGIEARVEVEVEARAGAGAGAGATTLAQAQTRANVLVVDDDELVRDGLAALLTAHGYQVCLAADVDEAARIAGAARAPDLALVDYRLPGERTALDAIEAIHTASRQAVPAIIITGDTHPQRLREVQALGHPVLFKPVPADALVEAVSKALSRSA